MIPRLLGLFLCFFTHSVLAQSPATINVSDCGTSTTLTSTTIPGYSNLIWDNGSTNTSRTVNASGAYWWQVTGASVVTNGNFSSGNTGFTSEYIYDNPTNASGSGAYFVGSSVTSWNPNMQGCSDHSSNDNNMLIVNGATTAGVKVWCQTHQVYPNANYNLSAYFEELHNQNYPVLQWNVNGINVGSAVTSQIIPCLWRQITTTWNSGIPHQAL